MAKGSVFSFKLAFDQLGQTHLPMLGHKIMKILTNFFKIEIDTKHFKMDFSVKKYVSSSLPSLSTVSKLYYTYYHLRLLMIVCIVLIWFLSTIL